MIIPAQRAIKVNCRANTGPVEETTPVFFEPDELGPWPDGLEVYETLTTITQGSMSKMKIDVINATNHDITLHKHTILGSLQLVRSVKPVEVKLAENSGSQTKKNATVSQSQANITEKTVTNDNGSHSDDRFPQTSRRVV